MHFKAGFFYYVIENKLCIGQAECQNQTPVLPFLFGGRKKKWKNRKSIALHSIIP